MKGILSVFLGLILFVGYAPAQTIYPGFPEKFDTEIEKDDYKDAELQFTTGPWRLKGVKLVTNKWGIDVEDDGTKGLMFQGNSTRLFVAEMKFDLPEGASRVTVKASSAGKDASCKWVLQASTDGGKKWKRVSNEVLTDNKAAREETFKVNFKAPVRFRILKLGLGNDKEDSSIRNGRLVIDNFTVYKK
ncbi:MAG TPA: hypothetical protein PKA53_00910 [Sphingobacterium sp.]|nr:hypothetical protein [Sphingobacterium sp.]